MSTIFLSLQFQQVLCVIAPIVHAVSKPLPHAPFSAEVASWAEPVLCFQIRDIGTQRLNFDPEQPSLKTNQPKRKKHLTSFFIAEIWKGNFCLLKAKRISFECQWTQGEIWLVLWERFSLSGLYFIYLFMCIVPSTMAFFSWHPKLLFPWNHVDCVKESTSHRSASAAHHKLHSSQRAI